MDTNSVLRRMAWERAKGELRAIEQTYNFVDNADKATDYCVLLTTFIEEVEDKGLQE